MLTIGCLVLTNIWKAFFPDHESRLLLVIKHCHCIRRRKINTIDLSTERRVHNQQLRLVIEVSKIKKKRQKNRSGCLRFEGQGVSLFCETFSVAQVVQIVKCLQPLHSYLTVIYLNRLQMPFMSKTR